MIRSPDDPPYPFSVIWTPHFDEFIRFVRWFRQITGRPLGGTKLSKHEYIDETVAKVLSVGMNDDLSSFPQRLSLHNFKLGPPITSYGCILRYLFEGTPYYLLIKRGNSLSYLDFIRGNYRESQLYFIIQDLSVKERELILNWSFEALWVDLHLKPAEGDIYEFGREAFDRICPHLKDLFEYLPPADPKGLDLWLFPKGKINWREVMPEHLVDEEPKEFVPESPLQCAHREFKEETNGIDLSELGAEPLYAHPVVERHLGSNSKNYQTNYFVYQASGGLPALTQFPTQSTEIRDVSTGEVSEIKWVSYNDLKGYLRPERIQLINWIEEHLPETPEGEVAERWRSVANSPEIGDS